MTTMRRVQMLANTATRVAWFGAPLLVIAFSAGCAYRQAQVQSHVRSELKKSLQPKIVGTTNYRGSNIEIDLYSSSGHFLDTWVTSQKAGQIELRLDRPAGEYEISIREAGALPGRFKVRYDASGTVYDLRLRYGDIDGDGDIDSIDANWVSRWQGFSKQDDEWEVIATKVDGRPVFPWVADFNSDSRIDLFDLKILEANLGLRYQ